MHTDFWIPQLTAKKPGRKDTPAASAALGPRSWLLATTLQSKEPGTFTESVVLGSGQDGGATQGKPGKQGAGASKGRGPVWAGSLLLPTVGAARCMRTRTHQNVPTNKMGHWFLQINFRYLKMNTYYRVVYMESPRKQGT